MNREIKSIAIEVKRRETLVVSTQLLTPKMKRVTFHSDELQGFESYSPDDHVKLFFPKEGSSEVNFQEAIGRDYTPMNFNPEARTLDIDFCLHGKGPASRWAINAEKGNKLIIAGPKGSRVVPYEFNSYFMIGDETALPTIKRRLMEMPKDAEVTCIIEVNNQSEVQTLPTATNLSLHWVFRNNAEAGDPTQLMKKIDELNLSKDECFTWVSCEKSSALKIKDYLMTHYGFEEKWIKATGYWRKM